MLEKKYGGVPQKRQRVRLHGEPDQFRTKVSSLENERQLEEQAAELTQKQIKPRRVLRPRGISAEGSGEIQCGSRSQPVNQDIGRGAN